MQRHFWSGSTNVLKVLAIHCMQIERVPENWHWAQLTSAWQLFWTQFPSALAVKPDAQKQV